MLIFLNVDTDGNITECLTGETIIPDREYDFFFRRDISVADDILNYKVAMNGFKADLVLRNA